MPASSSALMFSMVPYLVSPVTWRGRSFQRKRVRKMRSTHGLVIHHFRRGHQHLENDPGFAAIDDIVGMIAQMRASSFQAHRRGIGISGADFEVRCPLVEPMHLPLLPTFLRDPVVPCGIALVASSSCSASERTMGSGRGSGAHYALMKCSSGDAAPISGLLLSCGSCWLSS